MRRGMRRVHAKWILAGVLLAAGCDGARVDPFPPGVEPLEDNEADFPAPTADEPFPEEVRTVGGVEGRYNYSHARGYVHASVDELWALWAEDPRVIADRRNTSEQTVTFDVEEGYELSYAIRYVVHDLVTVEWTETSRGGFITDEVGGFIVRYQKTEGSTFLRLIEGSFIVRPVADGVCSFEAVHHQDAVGTDAEGARQVHRDQFQSLVAAARGEPLPEW